MKFAFLAIIVILIGVNLSMNVFAQQDDSSTSPTASQNAPLPADNPNLFNNNMLFNRPPATGPQKTLNSNVSCVPVGSPEEDQPAKCSLPGQQGLPASIGAVSCPLPGERVIGCGSFMSDPKYNRGVCSGPDPINRGHCGTKYGCYAGSVEATKNLRRAHSIDVDANPGDIVYLPAVNGESLVWNYQPGMSYSVADGDGGGFGHVFTAESSAGTWVIHLLHTNTAVIPPKSVDGSYNSGDPATTIADTGYDHLHINIGLNPEGPNGGSGWLDPESLGMCIN